MSEVTRARSVLANEVKRAKRAADRDDDPAPWTKQPPAVENARRDLAAAKLEAYITAIVAAAPTLSSDQTLRLTALLGTVVSPAQHDLRLINGDEGQG